MFRLIKSHELYLPLRLMNLTLESLSHLGVRASSERNTKVISVFFCSVCRCGFVTSSCLRVQRPTGACSEGNSAILATNTICSTFNRSRQVKVLFCLYYCFLNLNLHNTVCGCGLDPGTIFIYLFIYFYHWKTDDRQTDSLSQLSN